MKTSEVLRAAREKIERPEAWTKGCGAVTASGAVVFPTSEFAARWCAVGSIDAVTDGDLRANVAARAALRALTMKYISTIFWNDAPERTHAEVLAVFDAAIADAERVNA